MKCATRLVPFQVDYRLMGKVLELENLNKTILGFISIKYRLHKREDDNNIGNSTITNIKEAIYRNFKWLQNLTTR
jgi:hypothetical protein